MSSNESISGSHSPEKISEGRTALRLLGRLLIGAAIIVTLIALFYAEEDWRGKRAWENYRREAEARGVVLDWKKFVPPEVPDDQNFAMTPFLKPILDVNPDLLLPGQTRWRDTNGWNRANDFGKDILKAADQQGVSERQQLMNFEVMFGYLHDPKTFKWDTNVPSIMTREHAAGKLLAEMESLKPVLDEIRQASQRPYARFPVSYGDENPAGILLPHLALVKKLCSLLSIRACAELAAGDSEKAFEDVGLIVKLADSIEQEPMLISNLVRIACYRLAINRPLREGIAQKRWTDDQLKKFQLLLTQRNLLKQNMISLQGGERAFMGVRLFDFFRSHSASSRNAFDSGDENASPVGQVFGWMPLGFTYQEQVSYHRMFDEYLSPQYSEDMKRVFPSFAKSLPSRINFTNVGMLNHIFVKHDIMSGLLIPALMNASRKAGASQCEMDQAIVACAIERNRLTGNPLPEKLEELVPKFLEKAPLDVIGGEPLKYRKLDDTHFLLYGIGWNEKDDGGTVVMGTGKNATPDLSQGDWVWPEYPERGK